MEDQLLEALLRKNRDEALRLLREGARTNPAVISQALKTGAGVDSELLQKVLGTAMVQCGTDSESVLGLCQVLANTLAERCIPVSPPAPTPVPSPNSFLAPNLTHTIDDPLQRVERGLAAFRDGGFVVVQDSFDRENEGDLIIACELLTAEKMAFMINETSGLICATMSSKRCEELELPQMVERNTESHCTAFTVSVDYKHGTTTGISAADRALTAVQLADPSSKPSDFARPGHIFPLRAKSGGVLERDGHTETAVDLCRIAGLQPVGAICELANKDGTMMRTPELREFVEQHNIPLFTIEDLQAYRKTFNC